MRKERKLIHGMREAMENSAREIGMFIRIEDQENGFTEIDLYHNKGFKIFTAYDDVSSIFGFIHGFNQCLIIERGSSK